MGTQDKSPNNNNFMQRVKVYRLNSDGKWDDQGTGHVTVDYLERSEEYGVFVIDEEDNETLLLHRISSDDIYRKQEDTIISWRDPEFSTELALSFQETTGCSYIWDHICNVQRNMHFSSLTNETFNNANSELRELPPVELSTLPLILKTIVDSGITDQLHVTELILHDEDFFHKLMELFRVCEDLENLDGLHLIFKIIRGIILLNNAQIFEKIFGDELILDVIGCLEYDPELTHIHHRFFLKEHVVFKEAIPIKDPVVLSKVHQTYRVGYLKDVIFPRSLDEGIVASLNTIIHSNNAVVVSLLKDDTNFIKELFSTLKSPTTSIESRRTLVRFLHEFCTLSKSLQMVHQLRFFRDLVSEGLFDIIADVLQSEDKKLVLTGTDILVLYLNQDPNILRSYVTQQGGRLFELLVKNMLTDFGDDMHCQFLEIIRSLLDSYPYAPGSQRDTIVEIFYEKHLGQLIDAITASCPPNDVGETDSLPIRSGEESGNQCLKPEILLNICDLLCFCVSHHLHTTKCNFLQNNAIGKILCLTRRRERYLVAAAVRFVRMLVSRSDENLMNHFVKNNLLKPIVDAFVANGERYNLLNSAVLELFEYIRKENLKILLRYLIDTFWDQLATFESLPSILTLKVKYDQLQESAGPRSIGSLADQRKRGDERALEKEEEDYFNKDSDEEDSASAQTDGTTRSKSKPPALANGSSHPSPKSGGLVDYDDDEDDEDYKPPPRKMTEVSEEDEGGTEFTLKRKLASKEEPEPKRLQRSQKGLKTRQGVFAAFCSTLSKKATLNNSESDGDKNRDNNTTEPKMEDNGSSISTDERKNAELDKQTDEKNFTEGLNDSSTDNRQLGGNDCPMLAVGPSPEMAVNGT